MTWFSRGRLKQKLAGNRGRLAAGALILVLVSAAAAAQLVEEGFLVVRKAPNPVRVAVPEFLALNAAPAGDQAISNLTGKMREVISFTGLFEVIDPAAYPQPVTGAETGDFDAYTLIRAQYVIKGSINFLGNGQYQVEMHCYDVKDRSLVVGRRYSGDATLFNRMVLRFVDELLGWMHPSSGKGALDARIAYVSDRSKRNEIHVMDTDGSNDRAITRNRTLNLSPNWSPRGFYLVYTGYQDRNPDIYYADLNQGRQWKLYGARGLNLAGEFSPDGKKISFSREGKDGNVDIYLMNADGEGLTRITSSPAIDVSPTWSPDGKFLAFNSDRTGTPQIFILDLSAGVESPANPAVRVTFDGSYNTSPAWSPDGRYIAYTGRVNGQMDIFIVNMAGSAPEITKRITQTREDEENPGWSPDSRFLVFNSNKYGNYDIYIMSIYSHTPKRITMSAANERQPTWSPRITLN